MPRSRAAATAAALALAIAIASRSVIRMRVAGDREQAKRMFDRLTGTPPTPAKLDDAHHAC